jgi:protein-tyrosine phosphatase
LIDLHSHILPGLDDGAVDVTDSIAMARQAQDDGIDLVCATPHIRSDHDVRIPELASRVAVLNRELRRAGVGVEVGTGGEVAEPIVDELTAEELHAVSLGGGGRWILLEPAAGPLGGSFVATVERLAERGHRALVAHPERHFDEGSLAALAEATRRGALIQVTATALAESGPDWAPVQLARRGLLHVLSSDAHSSRYGRPLALSAGFERLRAIDELRPHADWIAHDAPRAIVAGEPVTAPYPPHPQEGAPP